MLLKKRSMIFFSLLAVSLLWGCRSSDTNTGYIEDLESESGMTYHLYVPKTYEEDKSYPLFLMLHGGIQTAGHFAFSTDMNAVAESQEAIVIYPEQSISRNDQRYWNWFLVENQTRDGLEILMLMEIVNLVMSQYNVNADYVFSMGLSAGAAMALNLAIIYPDIFQGTALAAGVPYGVADNAYEAYAVMKGVLPSIETTVNKAYNLVSEYRNDPIKVLVFHGNGDSRVSVENSYYIIDQMIKLNDLIDNNMADDSFASENFVHETLWTTDQVEYDKTIYFNQSKDPVLGLFIIKGMGHAWPGGNPKGLFNDEMAPSMSNIIFNFFINDNY